MTGSQHSLAGEASGIDAVNDQLVAEQSFAGLRHFLRNRLAVLGSLFILLMFVVMVFWPWLVPYPNDVADAVNFDRMLEPPSAEFWLGTDEAGRDILTRIMAGAGMSLSLGLVVIGVAIIVGVPLGMIAGYYGGWTERVIMRIVDVFSSVPALVLALAISVLLGPSLTNAMIALSIVWWRIFARIAHGQTLSLRTEPYVAIARQMGASDGHILFREILPNMASAILVTASLDAGAVILIGTSISFLGAGASPPAAEWGIMVASGRAYLPGAWWPSLFPGLAIFFTVMSLNMIGDGLRDVFAGE
ncbi:ABC transporter permease [Nitratireductor aquimarinus]|uniref:ABC transporter permease n=1 Tax=Nitratireductor aquimarinus TaxID=889300 RepID=UPI001A8E3603|nr:ABC transporter permease [Nitratireductor aquimarinus]MBN8245667.1 ABC transporter permease [Nitratireductor aquimarinus]MBY6134050.1 ABC transporter permease [Nitratireductor aquimarinus]MCA1305146.1 ABC transporter permease [Nitratireductor aquimarinus]